MKTDHGLEAVRKAFVDKCKEIYNNPAWGDAEEKLSSYQVAPHGLLKS